MFLYCIAAKNRFLKSDGKTVLGLDFSMKELYVDSNGYHADYPRFFRKARKKLAREQLQAESL